MSISSSSGSIGQTVNIPDLRSPERLASSGWRAVPRLTRDAMGVAWKASRREVTMSLGLQGLVGVVMTVQLLAADVVLKKVFENGRRDPRRPRRSFPASQF